MNQGWNSTYGAPQSTSQIGADPPDWKDLTVDERLDRCRRIIKEQASEISSLREQVKLLKDILIEHHHTTTGSSAISLDGLPNDVFELEPYRPQRTFPTPYDEGYF